MASSFPSAVLARAAPPETPIRIWRGDTLDQRRTPPWLVEGVLAMESLACLYAEPGIGKTFVAVYLALAIANGLRCLGGRMVHRGPVLFVVGEGEGWFRFRLAAWVKRHPKVKNPLANFFVVLRPINLFDDDEELRQFIESIELTFCDQPPVLIVFDTLSCCMGDGNESATPDMNRVVNAMKRLRRMFHCTVLAIHHPGKDVGKGMRGSTALRAALDTELFLRRLRGSKPFLELQCKKQKDGADTFPPIVLELVGSIALGVTDEAGTPITSAMIRYPRPREPSLAKQFATERRRETLARLVHLEKATYGGMMKRENQPKGIPHESLAKALRFLTKEGYAERRGTGKGAVYIATPEGKKALRRVEGAA